MGFGTREGGDGHSGLEGYGAGRGGAWGGGASSVLYEDGATQPMMPATGTMKCVLTWKVTTHSR